MEEEEKKIVYISGQVTGNPLYLAQFQNAQLILERNGCIAINMAAQLEEIADRVGWDDLMRICLAYLAIADEIVMLPNWQNSKGACMEYGYAGGAGIKIRELDDYVKKD